jgi:hypothetical protein
MRLLAGAGLALAALPLLVGCTSQAEEIHRKCATATDPAACERAEYQRMREADDKLFEENAMKSGGGGY